MSPVTHWPGCVSVHLPCAVDRIDAQRARILQLEALRGDAEGKARRLTEQVAELRDLVDEYRRRLGEVGP